MSELQRKSDRFLIVLGELNTFLSVIDKEDKLVKIKDWIYRKQKTEPNNYSRVHNEQLQKGTTC